VVVILDWIKWQELSRDTPIQDKNELDQKAQTYNRNILKGMKSYEDITLEVIRSIDENSVITVKQDGQFDFAFWWRKPERVPQVRGKQGLSPEFFKTALANGNTIIQNMPCLDELERVMESSNYSSVIFACELVRHGPKGEILRGGPARAYKQGKPEDNKLYVFDLVELDGNAVVGAYWERMALADTILKESNKSLLETVHWVKGGEDVAKDIWEHRVLPDDLEGIVIRTASGLMKVKVRHDIDVGVFAVEEGDKKYTGMLGSLKICFMDSDGDLRNTSSVGTGFSDEERREWWEWAMDNKVGEGTVEGDRVSFVKPERVISIKYFETSFPKTDCFFWNGKEYERRNQKKCVKFQKPAAAKECMNCGNTNLTSKDKTCPECGSPKSQFRVIIRGDKGFNPGDLRLDQVPGWVPETKYQKAATPGVVSQKIVKTHNKDFIQNLFGSAPKSSSKATVKPPPSPPPIAPPVKDEIQKFELPDGETVTYYPTVIPSVPFSKHGLTCSCLDWLMKQKCKHTKEIEKQLR
jgi:hypothetical protein